tara:strand:+ start:142 stop:1362 length:1221 start_codon:yes stop_codon:yes gene_type:complete
MIKVGLDIGNSKISLVVCDIRNDGYKKVLSFISKPTQNVKKSSIVNLNLIKKEISAILHDAEKESQTNIKSIILNIPATESFSVFGNSKIDISGEKINELHLKKALNNSDIFEPIENYQIIENLIIGYMLDKHTPIDDPIDNFGDSLTVNYYKFSVKKNFIKTVLSLFKDLNINIENFIPTPLSSALATLNKDDKALGAICIDLGASSSSIALFENEKLIYLDAINIGGKNITNDIARGVPTTINNAERLKNLYGSVISSPSDEYEIIDVPDLQDNINQSKQINRNTVNLIIKPRVEETLELIRQKLKDYNLHKRQIKNIILTGGGSLLEGITEYAEMIFDGNARVSKPFPINGLDKAFQNTQYSQTIGTILYDQSEFEIKFLKNKEKKQKNHIFRHFSSWLDKYI